MDTAATLAIFLPFALPWYYLPFGMVLSPIVRMLANPIASVCLAQAASKALADRCLWLLSTTKAAPPAPYLVSSLSSPYFRFTNMWTYRTWHNPSWTVFRWAISIPPCMVVYVSR